MASLKNSDLAFLEGTPTQSQWTVIEQPLLCSVRACSLQSPLCRHASFLLVQRLPVLSLWPFMA